MTVDGGWSDWSDWGTCSNACPGNLAGDYSGNQTRTRACVNPPPSPDGLPCPGPAIDAQACNTDLCVAWVMRCPGSSTQLAANPNPLLLPAVECSGHGSCNRVPLNCRSGDSCAAVCVCDADWDGGDCARSAEMQASIIALRKEHLALQAQSLASADLSSPSALGQQAQTLATIAQPDELVPSSRNTMLDIVSQLINASQSSMVQMAPTTGTSLLGVVSGAVFASINKAQVALATDATSSTGSGGRRLPVGSEWMRDLLDTTSGNTSATSALQQDAQSASSRMVSTVQSLSTSMMTGAVSGEEPVVITTTAVSLSLLRVSGATVVHTTPSGTGISVNPAAAANATGDVDVRAVAWNANPVRGALGQWRGVAFMLGVWLRPRIK